MMPFEGQDPHFTLQAALHGCSRDLVNPRLRVWLERGCADVRLQLLEPVTNLRFCSQKPGFGWFWIVLGAETYQKDPKSAMKRTVMASKEREERREELLTAFRETIDNQDLLGIREAGFPSHFDGL